MAQATPTSKGSLAAVEPSESNSFTCPITHQLFVDPVIASDGFSYERSAIDQWFKSSDKSPVTGTKITRALIPNHALRNAVQEVYPQQAELFQKRTSSPASHSLQTTTEGKGETTESSSDDTEFDFTKDEIFEMTRSRFDSPPTPGTVFYGLFEQDFREGDFHAKSTWTVRVEFESLQDYSKPAVLTACIQWRKHAQTFNQEVQSLSPELREFATTLSRTVGQTFKCRIRGTFDPLTGRLEMYAYEAENVGNGFYTLLLGQNGNTLDGLFYLRNFMDPSLPTTHGSGVLRLRRYTA